MKAATVRQYCSWIVDSLNERQTSGGRLLSVARYTRLVPQKQLPEESVDPATKMISSEGRLLAAFAEDQTQYENYEREDTPENICIL